MDKVQRVTGDGCNTFCLSISNSVVVVLDLSNFDTWYPYLSAINNTHLDLYYTITDYA